MSKPISDTERCQLFERLANEVWNKIIRSHDVNVEVPEIGITNHLITEILHYNKNHTPNFKVYAKNGVNEAQYGSDIDLSIEVLPGEYRRFALQAKVLSKSKRYKTLKDGNTTKFPTYQWQKLTDLEKKDPRYKGYYLLYNGMDNYRYQGNDSCHRLFSEEQFGCSLVELSTIAKFTMKKKNNRFQNPTFSDFHPKYADPWRTLVCCYLDKEDYRLFSREEIELGLDNYVDLSDELLKDPILEYRLPTKESEDSISKVYKEVDWNPKYRIVIRRTDQIE